MKKTLLYAAVFALGASMAQAALTTDQVVADFQAQGYTAIEVKQGPTQIKVEAIMGDQKIEIVYDIETGAVLKQETSTVEAGDDISAGVSVRTRTSDFVGSGHDDHDDEADDDSNDSGDDEADDDGSDDDHGSDHDSDHEDSGSDDDGSDDDGDDGDDD